MQYIFYLIFANYARGLTKFYQVCYFLSFFTPFLRRSVCILQKAKQLSALSPCQKPSPQKTAKQMSALGRAVRTYEKNAVADGYTSSYSLRLFPSPQGEGLLNSALWGNKF